MKEGASGYIMACGLTNQTRGWQLLPAQLGTGHDMEAGSWKTIDREKRLKPRVELLQHPGVRKEREGKKKGLIWVA